MRSAEIDLVMSSTVVGSSPELDRALSDLLLPSNSRAILQEMEFMKYYIAFRQPLSLNSVTGSHSSTFDTPSNERECVTDETRDYVFAQLRKRQFSPHWLSLAACIEEGGFLIGAAQFRQFSDEIARDLRGCDLDDGGTVALLGWH